MGCGASTEKYHTINESSKSDPSAAAVRYVGELDCHGARSGHGTLLVGSTSVPIRGGRWKDDKLEGSGFWLYPNNDKYSGTFVADERQGEGRMVYSSGPVVEFMGGWFHNLKEGEGHLKWRDGHEFKEYFGTFRNDAPNGRGHLLYSSGEEFFGEFLHGSPHGFGLKHNVARRVAECGRFEKGKLMETCAIPTSAVSSIHDLNLTSQENSSSLLFPNGDYYCGPIDVNQPDGENGTLFDPQHLLKRCGDWEKGQLINKKTYQSKSSEFPPSSSQLQLSSPPVAANPVQASASATPQAATPSIVRPLTPLPPAFDVFLSHKRSDAADFCRALWTELHKMHGYRVFIDEEDNDDLNDLLTQVRRSKTVLFVLSTHIFESEWCMKELETALAAKCQIILVTKQNSSWDGHDFPPSALIPKSVVNAFNSKSIEYRNAYHEPFIQRVVAKIGRPLNQKEREVARIGEKKENGNFTTITPSYHSEGSNISLIPHVIFFECNPLVAQTGDQPRFATPDFNSQPEYQCISNALHQSLKLIHTQMLQCNRASLQRTLAACTQNDGMSGPRVIHYAGRFTTNNKFSLEGDLGVLDALSCDELKQLVAAHLIPGQKSSLQLVVLVMNAPSSAAQALIDSGVPHVIYVDRSLMPSQPLHAFIDQLYTSLALGTGIQSAFEIAYTSIEDRSKTALMVGFLPAPVIAKEPIQQLPFSAPSLFHSFLEGESQDLTPSLPLHHLPLPSLFFQGRNLFIQQLLQLLEKHRLATLHGVHLMGKTCLALAVARYMLPRGYQQGYLFLELARVATGEVNSLFALLAEACTLSGIGGIDSLSPSQLESDLLPMINRRCSKILIIVDGVNELMTQNSKSNSSSIVVNSTVTSPINLATNVRLFISQLLKQLPNSRVLATSTFPLEFSSEAPATHSSSDVVEEALPVAGISPMDSALLFYNLSPRPLALEEFGCKDPRQAVATLSMHPALKNVMGNPGLLEKAARLLGTHKMDEIAILVKDMAEKELSRR